MQPYRIILADDHAMFRQGIKRILDDIEDLDVVGEVGDGLQLLKLIRTLPADMVVMDISMPGMRGIANHPHPRGRMAGPAVHELPHGPRHGPRRQVHRLRW